jgi:hypothetical protein
MGAARYGGLPGTLLTRCYALVTAAPGDIGLGDPFSMPYVTIEAVLPLGRARLAIVNDTNFGSTGRNPMLPDYSDFIVVKAPGVQGKSVSDR